MQKYSTETTKHLQMFYEFDFFTKESHIDDLASIGSHSKQPAIKQFNMDTGELF